MVDLAALLDKAEAAPKYHQWRPCVVGRAIDNAPDGELKDRINRYIDHSPHTDGQKADFLNETGLADLVVRRDAVRKHRSRLLNERKGCSCPA